MGEEKGNRQKEHLEGLRVLCEREKEGEREGDGRETVAYGIELKPDPL